jgi:Undecaprenyl-phosphate glucose phosphotransferase
MNYRRSQGWYSKRVLLIGYDETANMFRKMIESTPILGYKFIGYVTHDACNKSEIPKKDRSHVLGNTSQLEQIVKENDIHAVFSVFSFLKDAANIDEQLIVCNQTGARMYLIAENQWWMRKSRAGDYIGQFYILNPQHIPLDDVTNRILKRGFDIFFSLLVILCFGWNLLPLIVCIIKLTSKGPVFFVQERTGLSNAPFRCYKFRSMYVNEEADAKQATKNDSRITPFGRFMRKWNIDEYPQFFNVLFGRMSIVGPRPHMLSQTEQYSALIKYYKVRHYVKPGITGWAQVIGWRGETDETWKMEKRVKCDMDYIENWTFFWDIKIIWLTVFGGKARENAG